jgi:hypothetical protein
MSRKLVAINIFKYLSQFIGAIIDNSANLTFVKKFIDHEILISKKNIKYGINSFVNDNLMADKRITNIPISNDIMKELFASILKTSFSFLDIIFKCTSMNILGSTIQFRISEVKTSFVVKPSNIKFSDFSAEFQNNVNSAFINNDFFIKYNINDILLDFIISFAEHLLLTTQVNLFGVSISFKIANENDDTTYKNINFELEDLFNIFGIFDLKNFEYLKTIGISVPDIYSGILNKMFEYVHNIIIAQHNMLPGIKIKIMYENIGFKNFTFNNTSKQNLQKFLENAIKLLHFSQIDNLNDFVSKIICILIDTLTINLIGHSIKINFVDHVLFNNNSISPFKKLSEEIIADKNFKLFFIPKLVQDELVKEIVKYLFDYAEEFKNNETNILGLIFKYRINERFDHEINKNIVNYGKYFEKNIIKNNFLNLALGYDNDNDNDNGGFVFTENIEQHGIIDNIANYTQKSFKTIFDTTSKNIISNLFDEYFNDAFGIIINFTDSVSFQLFNNYHIIPFIQAKKVNYINIKTMLFSNNNQYTNDNFDISFIQKINYNSNKTYDLLKDGNGDIYGSYTKYLPNINNDITPNNYANIITFNNEKFEYCDNNCPYNDTKIILEYINKYFDDEVLQYYDDSIKSQVEDGLQNISNNLLSFFGTKSKNDINKEIEAKQKSRHILEINTNIDERIQFAFPLKIKDKSTKQIYILMTIYIPENYKFEKGSAGWSSFTTILSEIFASKDLIPIISCICENKCNLANIININNNFDNIDYIFDIYKKAESYNHIFYDMNKSEFLELEGDKLYSEMKLMTIDNNINVIGGNINYKIKYMKYKTKYHESK